MNNPKLDLSSTHKLSLGSTLTHSKNLKSQKIQSSLLNSKRTKKIAKIDLFSLSSDNRPNLTTQNSYCRSVSTKGKRREKILKLSSSKTFMNPYGNSEEAQARHRTTERPRPLRASNHGLRKSLHLNPKLGSFDKSLLQMRRIESTVRPSPSTRMQKKEAHTASTNTLNRSLPRSLDKPVLKAMPIQPSVYTVSLLFNFSHLFRETTQGVFEKSTQ